MVKRVFPLIAAITPNDTDNLISMAIGTGSCLIGDLWSCVPTLLSVLAYGAGQSISTTPSLTSEEIELIREYGYDNEYSVRWPDGYVDVYDATNYSQMQKVLNEWNPAIGGPVVFRLSNNPNSPVKVYFKSMSEYCGGRVVNWDEEDYTLSTIDVQISNNASSCGYPDSTYSLYLFEFKNVAGFAGWTTKDVNPTIITPYEEWTNFTEINDTMKKMVKALYKVPPGYYLGDTK